MLITLSEEIAGVEHQLRRGTLFVAPVVPGIEAEAEVILFGSHAKVRANLDIVGKREVVGALSTGEPHLAVDITITHGRHDREREVRTHLEAVGIERLRNRCTKEDSIL